MNYICKNKKKKHLVQSAIREVISKYSLSNSNHKMNKIHLKGRKKKHSDAPQNEPKPKSKALCIQANKNKTYVTATQLAHIMVAKARMKCVTIQHKTGK